MGGSPRFWGWHGALMSPPCLLLRGDGLSQATHAAQPAAVRPTEGAAVPALRPALGDTGDLGDAAVTGHGDGRRESPLSVAVTTCCLRAPVGREAGPWQHCLADEASPLRCPDGGGPGDTRGPARVGGAGGRPPGGFRSDALGNWVASIGDGPRAPDEGVWGSLSKGPGSPLSASLHLPGAATRGCSCPAEAAVPALPGPGICGAGQPPHCPPGGWNPRPRRHRSPRGSGCRHGPGPGHSGRGRGHAATTKGTRIRHARKGTEGPSSESRGGPGGSRGN